MAERLAEALHELGRLAIEVNNLVYFAGAEPTEIDARLGVVLEHLTPVLREARWVPKSMVSTSLFVLYQLEGRGAQPGRSRTEADGSLTSRDPVAGPVLGADTYSAVADRWRRGLVDLFGELTISG